MSDEATLSVMTFFVVLAASVSVPYIVCGIADAGDGRVRISPNGFSACAIGIIFLMILCIFLLDFKHLLLAIGLALGIGCSLIHPVTAISFFISLLFLRPWELLPTDSLLRVLPRSMAAITAGVWIVGMIKSSGTRVALGVPGVLFALLLVWIFSSCLFAPSPSTSLRIFFESFLPTSVLVFLILNSIRSERDLLTVQRSFIISGVGIVALAIYITYRDYINGVSDFRLHSLGLWGNANDLGALAVLILPFAVWALRSARSGGAFLAALIASAVLIVALLWSQSRAAQGAALLAGALYVVVSGGGLRVGVGVGIVVLVITAIAAAMPQRDSADTQGSSDSRYNYIVAGLRMARAHPAFGVGLGNYPHLYEQYAPAVIESGDRTAHSTWILILAETGIVGACLLIALFMSVVRRAGSLRSCAPQYLLSVIAYGVAMSFLSHTYLFLPYVFMAWVVVSARVLGRAASHTGSPLNRIIPFAAAVWISIPQSVVADELISFGASPGIDKPMPGEFRATSEAIALHGSRGEVVTFLLKIDGKGCFELAQSRQEPAPTNTSMKVALFDLESITTHHPSFSGVRVGAYLDPVVPLRAPITICLGDRGSSRWLLGEVAIPRDGHPGEYRYDLTLGDRRVAIKIGVWPMILPEIPTLPAYAELTPWFLVLAHHGKWDESEAQLAQLYAAAMIEHRMLPLKSIIAPPKVVSAGLDQNSSIDRLDLINSPSPQASFSAVVLNGRPKWAYFDLPTVGANGTKPINYDEAKRYFSAIENTLPVSDRADRAIVYLWDEPKEAAFPELLKLSRLVQHTAPSLKQLVTTPYAPQLRESVNIFAPVINQYDAPGFPAHSVYQDLRQHGIETWWYVSCMSHGCEALRDPGVPDMVIDRSASYVRSIGWLSMRYSIDAFLYYSVNNGFQFAPRRDPWDDLWDFSGNGDGTLFYPGRSGEHGLNTHQPITSLRLKLWRESSYDADYIRWMNELPSKPSWWEREFATLVQSTTDWDKRYASYQRLRDRAGEYLSRLHTDEQR